MMRRIRHIYHFLFRKYRKISSASLLVLALMWWFCLPRPLFQDPVSKVLTDADGALMSARIASDGQWRFPEQSSVPQKFAAALIEFEDRRFYAHMGFDLFGILRAAKQNFKNGKIVSGASTLTMQTARLARKNKPRTVFQKIIEIIWATRMELRYSKQEILSLYASHAPFGGNVVGLDAACWRYYGKSPELLSWGEAATLAVLPNSPSLIHPGRNREALQTKRNRLLDRLEKSNVIDALTCKLAKSEELPDKPLPLPDLAPHLLNRAFSERKKQTKNNRALFESTLNIDLQKQVNRVLRTHNLVLKANEIHNLAAIVIDVRTRKVLAYAGNAETAGFAHGQAVDIVKAPRSTGSILKPFLYAQALDEGLILPQSLLLDVPTNIGGYQPENFNRKYDGRVPADQALIRSLNVPMVHLLQDYGQEKFHKDLQKMGLTTINKPPSHYGLTLVLGGAEGSLWDITNAYAAMARSLNNFQKQSGEYRIDDFEKANYLTGSADEQVELVSEAPVLSAAAIYKTLNAMKEVERPNESGDWEQFSSGSQIAWKTGTSFGFRDAWAVGLTPDYAVGVWAGNADGEGRPGCVGVLAAAPVLFDIFSLLPQKNNRFDIPYDEMTEIKLCRQSGQRALKNCPVDSVFVPNNGLKSLACSFHKNVHLDAEGKYLVTETCLSPTLMQHQTWFVLSPTEEYYYKKKHPEYQSLPPYMPACRSAEVGAVMQFVYPKANAEISIPREINGEKGRVIFRAVHRNPEKKIYWHLDDMYLGTTEEFHNFEFLPELGKHKLTLVDEAGARTETTFFVVE